MATINDVRLDQPVTFTAFRFESTSSMAVESLASFEMSAEVAHSFVSELAGLSCLDLIEATLQGLCERKEGTRLKTAFPNLEEFQRIASTMKSTPPELMSLLGIWKGAGANEVNIDFEEKVILA